MVETETECDKLVTKTITSLPHWLST